ncbi:uncharacterized protein MELLADRAFT_66678 [Melampsora larici-populina 98AG31]|uniref:Uncharacterized protein n=1 Tax=Melampsora larici-populina (strain 98AG31 / pathotype 3-4-7) TaxID=747676 RepID=F4S065_MELLP|nr:uncharacterized protein MELLADRAFT_66678 [Melampsora larici-populina 98AG31]EGG01906.1 hypothetical protein MELLADRAFT_66678 [Melampsora larici-populina 98AG31]
MCRPSPDSRRRVSIDQIILASGSTSRHKKKTPTLQVDDSEDKPEVATKQHHKRKHVDDSEDEPEVAPKHQNKRSRKTASINDEYESEATSSPVANRQKKGKAKATSARGSRSVGKEVCQSF